MDRGGIQIPDPGQDGAIADLLRLTGTGTLEIIDRVKARILIVLDKPDSPVPESTQVILREVITGRHVGIGIIGDLSLRVHRIGKSARPHAVGLCIIIIDPAGVAAVHQLFLSQGDPAKAGVFGERPHPNLVDIRSAGSDIDGDTENHIDQYDKKYDHTDINMNQVPRCTLPPGPVLFHFL